jgi:hypothetical protein
MLAMALLAAAEYDHPKHIAKKAKMTAAGQQRAQRAWGVFAEHNSSCRSPIICMALACDGWIGVTSKMP